MVLVLFPAALKHLVRTEAAAPVLPWRFHPQPFRARVGVHTYPVSVEQSEPSEVLPAAATEVQAAVSSCVTSSTPFG
jgi:hypothetical protein